MKNVPENELFSAYLDGELTADEERRVEQLLAESGSARRLVDELRSLSAMVQSLPREKLPTDFSAEVVREARRRVFAEDSSPSRSLPSDTSEAPDANDQTDGEQHASQKTDAGNVEVDLSWRGIARRIVRPHNFLWAMVAASIGLVFYLADVNERHGGEQRGGQVAVHDANGIQTRPSMGAPPAGDETPERGAAETRLDDSGDEPAMEADRVVPSERMEVRALTDEAEERYDPSLPEGLAASREAADGSQRRVLEAMIEPDAPRPSGGAVARSGSAALGGRPAVAVEVVCDVEGYADLDELVSRLVARRNAVPDNALPGEGWEFAADTERRQQPKHKVRVADVETPGGKQRVVEFSANAAQLQAVLAELETDPHAVRTVQVPTALGLMRQNLAKGQRMQFGAGERARAAKAGRPELAAASESGEEQRGEPGPREPAERPAPATMAQADSAGRSPSAPDDGRPAEMPSEQPAAETQAVPERGQPGPSAVGKRPPASSFYADSQPAESARSGGYPGAPPAGLGGERAGYPAVAGRSSFGGGGPIMPPGDQQDHPPHVTGSSVLPYRANAPEPAEILAKEPLVQVPVRLIFKQRARPAAAAQRPGEQENAAAPSGEREPAAPVPADQPSAPDEDAPAAER